MLVFHDFQRAADPRQLITALGEQARELSSLSGEPPKKSAVVRLLIESGELVQGVLDAEFFARDRDEWGTLEMSCSRLMQEAARMSIHGSDRTEEFVTTLSVLARNCPAEQVRLRRPEGFAFYALYPELYIMAARELAARCSEPLVVIGLRSIGTTLSAVVAEAYGPPALPPVTLRPCGPPFERTVSAGPSLTRLVSEHAGAQFAIVDEGPGLSGSSFCSVIEWLERNGVPAGRIQGFPGHAGDPGPRASAAHLERWQRSNRCVVDFDRLLLSRDFVAGGHWFESSLANDELGLIDIAAGRWRELHIADRRNWPPSDRFRERRKYVYRHGGAMWLAKFAGLGRPGEAKLAVARQLSAAGLIPPPRELRYGFLIGRWLNEAQPVERSAFPHRGLLIESVADYLRFRHRELPADQAPGSAPAELLVMAKANVSERFGLGLARELDFWDQHVRFLTCHVERMLTDNRMHAWEWLLLPEGRLVKADALDHSAEHDCIGAQDLAWDLAGAAVEFELEPGELRILESRIARRGSFRPHPLSREFHRLCYLAFQLGYYTLAAQSASNDDEERLRLLRAADRYAASLRGQVVSGWQIDADPA